MRIVAIGLQSEEFYSMRAPRPADGAGVRADPPLSPKTHLRIRDAGDGWSAACPSSRSMPNEPRHRRCEAGMSNAGSLARSTRGRV